MSIGDLFGRSIDSLLYARSRTIFTTLSIGVAAFSLATAISINNGGGAYVQKIINANTEPQTLWVLKKQDSEGSATRPSRYTGDAPLTFNYIAVQPIDEDDLNAARQTPGVESVKPYVSVNDGFVTRAGQDKFQIIVTAQHTNDSSYPLAGNVDDLKDDEVIVPEGYADALQFATPDDAIGKTIGVAVRNLNGIKVTTKVFNLRVSAVVRESREVLMASTLRVTQNTALQMYKFSTKNTPMQDRYPAAVAKVTSIDAMQKTKQNLIAKGFEAQTQMDRDRGLASFVNVFQTVLILFGILAVVTAVFGIVNTQYMSVMQRVQAIGLMKALGTGKRDVAMLFRLEAGLIGFFGATVGVGLTYLMGTLLNPLLVQAASLDQNTAILRMSPLDLGGVVIGLTIVATVAGLVPAKRAANMDPIEALRNEAE